MVTYHGEPVPGGFIVLEPDLEEGNDGPGVGVRIENGHYATLPGKGILGGAYVVKIRGNDGVSFVDEFETPVQGKPTFGPLKLKVQFPYESTVHDFHLPEDAKQ